MVTAAKKTAAPAKKAAAPARKTTAAKPAPKPAAKRSASAPKPPVKKTATTKPPVTDEDAEVSEEVMDNVRDQFFGLIKNGFFDYCFTALLDVIEDRETWMAEQVREAKKKVPAKKTTTTTAKVADKKVPMPTRAAKFVPVVGSVYSISEGPLKGATLKFAGFIKDDENKAKGEIVKSTSNAPTGKKVVVPTNVLKKPAPRGRRTK